MKVSFHTGFPRKRSMFFHRMIQLIRLITGALYTLIHHRVD